ncbi:hypothetical protein BJV82DRAFT_595222 [Fennellomyces sp. T-0311]|nr:hypothetical protein BJV82DRAFT_595222 [Fennellomyces sp. T-0311]
MSLVRSLGVACDRFLSLQNSAVELYTATVVLIVPPYVYVHTHSRVCIILLTAPKLTRRCVPFLSLHRRLGALFHCFQDS